MRPVMADTLFLSRPALRLGRPLLGLLLGLAGLLCAAAAQAEKVRDIANFAGVRNNKLVGYGLVAGLDNSGDQTTQTPFTEQGLTNMLSQLGITVPQGKNMQMRNIAAVMVTADMPPFARPGQQLDVVVSSVGNARSLRGGTLLMTPLKGPDGQVYALAQGNLLLNGASAAANGSSVQINQQGGGRIAGGATVERPVPLQLGDANGALDLYLHQPDFATAQRVVYAINRDFGRAVASAVDGGLVRLAPGPQSPNGQVNFMARVENVEVTPAVTRPKVILNSRTGAVVLNGQVKLHRAAVAHGNLSIVIDTQNQVVQPGPFSQGQTAMQSNSNISIEQKGGALHMVEGAADLMDVVKALNALGATPQDLMSILEALKAAGSLRADLEII